MLEIPFIPGHPLSYTTTRIEVFSGGQSIGFGTGFSLRFGASYGLVTNWHVLSGRNPLTGSVLSTRGDIPDRVVFHVLVSTKLDSQSGKKSGVQLFFKPMEVDLAHESSWHGLEEDGIRHDVAVIPLNEHVPELSDPKSEIRAIEGGRVTLTPEAAARLRADKSARIEVESMRYLYPQVGSDVFILGYPLGMIYSGVFPIWKRGSIASDPQEPVQVGENGVRNLFYVDALTKRGMSGAPVIYFPRKDDVLRTVDNIHVAAGRDPIFLGVYAGRDGVTNDEYEMALGRVWKAESVAQLFLPKNRKERA